MTQLEKFCRILKERSFEHSSAVELMFNNGHYGQVISILRQELDSLVRVIFLLNIPDLQNRNHYINQTLSNVKWTQPNSRTVITDRQMVELTDSLHGWTKSVYKLGCAFIHLSPLIDYKTENPFLQLAHNEIIDIKRHLNDYHGFPLTNELNIATISPYLLRVFNKVSSNLAYYIRELEEEVVGNL